MMLNRITNSAENTTMLKLVRTNSDNPDFIHLVKLLDADLTIRDGDETSFYSQFNKITTIRYVVVAYERGKPLGCGAIKEYDQKTMEVKRMYVSPAGRQKGVATRILLELEQWARDLSCEKCILETGKRQPEAIGLYEKSGYALMSSNYGQYAGVENSLCFEKKLR
jgi:GNAT superfamily N-acetyltransferase